MEATTQDSQSTFRTFVTRYVERGFGTLSKKEIDRLVFELLIDVGDIETPFDPHAIARKLRVSPAKAASLIYEYEMFLPTVRDEAWIKAQFSTLLKKTRLGKEDKDKVKLEVRDKLLREEIEDFIRRNELGPAPDYRPNRNLLEIEFDTFCNLLAELSDESTLGEIEKELVKRKIITERFPSSRELINVFLRSAAGRAGEKTVDLSAALISGNVISMIKGIFL